MNITISENIKIVLDGQVFLLESGDQIVCEEDTIDMSPDASKVINYMLKVYQSVDEGNSRDTLDTLKIIYRKVPTDFQDDIRKIYTLIKKKYDKRVVMKLIDKFYTDWENTYNKKNW